MIAFLKNIINNKSFLKEQQIAYLLNTTDSLVRLGVKYKFTNESIKQWEELFSVIEFNQNSFSDKDFYILYNIKNFGYFINIYGNGKYFAKSNRFRDSIMALNCIYLKERFYSKRLAVISAASFHLIKNYSLDYPKWAKGTKTMGEFLTEKYAYKYSVTIFTSAIGKHAIYSSKKEEKVPRPKKHSFEKILFDKKYLFYYTNLHDNKMPFIYCMPDGYNYIKMPNPLIHFDSIFYVREMQRTTPISNTPKS